MYNTFENKDGAEFWRQLGKFGLLALLYIINAVYRLYFQQMLYMEWRSWLNDNFLKRFLRELQLLRSADGSKITFYVGNEMFFGKDRLRDVEEEIVKAKAKA
jgi:ABC-type uncharacterized transport system fused permease/ATPase subunit